MRTVIHLAPHLLGCFLILSSPLAAQQKDAAAQRLLLEAERLERDGDPEDARQEYELLIQRFPQSIEAEHALLALARSHWQARNAVKAGEILAKLTKEYADSPTAAAAWVLRGQFQVEEAATREDLEEARTPFRRVPLLFGVDEYPRLDARVEARVRSGQVNLLLEEPLLAAMDFLEAIEDERPSPWLPTALYGYAVSLLQQEQWVAAAEALDEVLRRSESTEALRSEARIHLAFIHRHWLRPSLGQPRWSTSRAFPVGWVPKKPSKVAAGPDGRLIVFDAGTQQAVLLSHDGEAQGRKTLTEGRDVWWSWDGQPYANLADSVVDLASGSSQTFSISGDPVKNIMSGQRGIYREWLILDREKKALCRFHRGGKPTSRPLAAADVIDLAIGAHGEVLLLDKKSKQITVLDQTWNVKHRVSGSWRRPEAIAADSAGNIYVLDTAQKTVMITTPDGAARGSFGPVLPGGTELKNPADITLDGEGRLFIADARLAQVFVLE